MNRIAELRKSRGISQIELAKELHIAQNTLSQYENELRNPTVNIIKSIADFFGVTTNYVLGYAEVNNTDGNGNDFALNKVTKIMTIHSGNGHSTDEELNLYLDLGWKLIHIGTESDFGYDGAGSASVLYTLGWYGEPSNAKHVETEEPGAEYTDWV